MGAHYRRYHSFRFNFDSVVNWLVCICVGSQDHLGSGSPCCHPDARHINQQIKKEKGGGEEGSGSGSFIFCWDTATKTSDWVVSRADSFFFVPWNVTFIAVCSNDCILKYWVHRTFFSGRINWSIMFVFHFFFYSSSSSYFSSSACYFFF